jgi:outer membrane protein assembly factor BamB
MTVSMTRSLKSAGRTTTLSLSVVLLCGVCFAQPAVTLSVNAGPPATSLTVSGSGYPASTQVYIYFDTANLALTVTNTSGSFSGVKIQVPASARPGRNWVTGAVALVTGDAAQAPFNVRTNWTQFHFAPSHTGLNPYENVLSQTTAPGLGLRWSYLTGNAVYSSPAVADGVVYVGSDDGNIDAVNAGTGALLWEFTTAGAVTSSPAVANGMVFAGSEDGNVYALDSSRGAKLWQFTTGAAVDSSPAVANGVVYIGSEDHFVYALNASTGALLWRFATGAPVYSSPAVANGAVYIGSDDNNVYALNAGTGAMLWNFTAGSAVDSSPTIANGVVYVGADNNDIYALSASSGAELWNYFTGAAVVSSPAVANGVVYVGSLDGYVYAISVSTGALLWTAPGTSSATVANGVVYVTSEYTNTLYAVNAANGANLWQFVAGGALLSTPTVVNGAVYIGSGDHNIYAFSNTATPALALDRPDPALLRPALRLGR